MNDFIDGIMLQRVLPGIDWSVRVILDRDDRDFICGV